MIHDMDGWKDVVLERLADSFQLVLHLLSVSAPLSPTISLSPAPEPPLPNSQTQTSAPLFALLQPSGVWLRTWCASGTRGALSGT